LDMPASVGVFMAASVGGSTAAGIAR
jgi:hypothetical protein